MPASVRCAPPCTRYRRGTTTASPAAAANASAAGHEGGRRRMPPTSPPVFHTRSLPAWPKLLLCSCFTCACILALHIPHFCPCSSSPCPWSCCPCTHPAQLTGCQSYALSRTVSSPVLHLEQPCSGVVDKAGSAGRFVAIAAEAHHCRTEPTWEPCPYVPSDAATCGCSAPWG